MNDDARAIEMEKALDERVRQAEVLITAQVTFLAAAYHRSAVLAGVVFAIVVAMFGITYTDLINPVIIDVLRPLALLSIIPLILLVCATALTRANLPGAIDIISDPNAKGTELKEALLHSYRWSSRRNEWRLAGSRYIIVSVAVTLLAMGIILAVLGYDRYALEQFLSRPELAEKSWDDQRGPVRDFFRRRTSSSTDEQREAAWNRMTPALRYSLIEASLRSTSEGGSVATSVSRPIDEGTTIGNGNIDNQTSGQ